MQKNLNLEGKILKLEKSLFWILDEKLVNSGNSCAMTESSRKAAAGTDRGLSNKEKNYILTGM